LGLSVEVPIMSGDLGNFYENGTVAKYKAKAIILESSYAISDSWKLTFNGGQVSGQAAGGNDFEAMYLHPNYQVANLLFRYDLRGIAGNQNIYESYINNAT